MSGVFEYLQTTISSICDIDPEMITKKDLIGSGLKIDSVDFLDIVFELDRKYGIKVPLEEWMNKVANREADEAEYFQVGNFCANVEMLIGTK